ncbi:MAG TPA: ATP-binding protein, partial [Nitriliruptoraceae bacterium]|nr:ATP-binding protein [Nitriliruptoraceae bacterium]
MTSTSGPDRSGQGVATPDEATPGDATPDEATLGDATPGDASPGVDDARWEPITASDEHGTGPGAMQADGSALDDHRTPGDDPFTPGYGVVPQVFAGRQAEFADFEGVVLRRVAQGTYEPARLLTGDRGMGKTALLKQFEAEASEAGHWVARISAVRGDAALPDLVEAVVDALDDVGVATRLDRAAKQAL